MWVTLKRHGNHVYAEEFSLLSLEWYHVPQSWILIKNLPGFNQQICYLIFQRLWGLRATANQIENTSRYNNNKSRPDDNWNISENTSWVNHIQNNHENYRFLIIFFVNDSSALELIYDPQEPQSFWQYQQDPDATLIRSVSTRDLISWSFQIARGMDYLASKKVTIQYHAWRQWKKN